MDKRDCVIVGIMQPYFMPYIGYWQLLNAVDKYVVYDDVNFIKGGWINRNRILLNGEVKYVNVPMLGASPNKLINEVQVNSAKKEINKAVGVVESAYKKAPYFKDVFPMIERIMYSENKNLAEFIVESFRVICDYLDIKTELIISSTLEKDCSLKAEEKVLDICERLGATDYYNAIGGQELYSSKHFAEKGIQLHFLKTNDIRYEQFGAEFESNLSIIDVLMFNSKEEVKKMLDEYSLVKE